VKRHPADSKGVDICQDREDPDLLGFHVVLFWPLVVPNGRIVRSQPSDELYFLLIHLRVGRCLGFPQNLSSDREVAPLVTSEILRDQITTGAAKVVNAIG
jgi:hypothetical protein